LFYHDFFVIVFLDLTDSEKNVTIAL
jgi:hypothetical protein